MTNDIRKEMDAWARSMSPPTSSGERRHSVRLSIQYRQGSDTARNDHGLCDLKKAAANANHAGERLDNKAHKLIVQVCDEILDGPAS